MTIDAAVPIPIASPPRSGRAGWRLRPWWPYLLPLLGWELLAVLEAGASYVDAGHGGHGQTLSAWLLSVMPLYLPLVLNSWVLARVFSRYQDRILRPPLLLLALLASMAIFLPLLTLTDNLILLLREGRPAADFPAMLLKGGRMAWWYNIFVVGLAFLAQAMATFWWRAQQEQLSAQRAQTEQLALRLGLLQGQLKPHFLFNALNSISALVRTADWALAEQALGKLGELLNYALAAGQGRPTSVADELDFLRVYLELQSLRYGDRMRLAWHVAPRDWSRHACPPLLFQPLAENAVHHGVEPHAHACTIHIALEYAAGVVCLRIANPVPAAASGGHGHGLGLHATRERLAILFGPRADLSIETDQHDYTVSLRFPAGGPQLAEDRADRR